MYVCMYVLHNVCVIAKYVYKSMLNKRWIILPVVYRHPFASKAVWAILKDFEFSLYKILQNR